MDCMPGGERVALLEEALAECLAWIREQDVYQDSLSNETSWLPRLCEIRSPLGDSYDPVQRSVLGQQVEVYDSGVILAYDRYHAEDQFGGMSQVELDPDEWSPFEIDIDTYQRETAGQPFNRAA